MDNSPFPDDDCSHEWLILTDGTDGVKAGCTTFAMGGYSRIARNKGADLYISYKGSPKSPCVAFCAEDLQDGYREEFRNKRELFFTVLIINKPV